MKRDKLKRMNGKVQYLDHLLVTSAVVRGPIASSAAERVFAADAGKSGEGATGETLRTPEGVYLLVALVEF